MTEEQHCGAQLQRSGVAPESVRYLVQTHLHIDHTGALGHFPDATVVVHARELDAARTAEEPLARGYVRTTQKACLRWQTVQDDHDLFGDGRIRLFQTPGHSAGHMSLLLELEETGPILITADAVDDRSQWEGRRALRVLHSREDAVRSLERLRELARETDPLLIFGHDPEGWSALRHGPESYN